MDQSPPPGVEQQHFSLYETLEATFYAVSWEKDAKFLLSLAVLPVTLLAALLGTRRSGTLILAVSGLLILLAQPLNEYLRHNWKTFTSQNYFDENGLFFSIFWSGPLLVVFAVSATLVMRDVFRSLKLPRQSAMSKDSKLE